MDQKMKFNMGCGHNKQPGFVNVDAFAECEPDQVWDLEQTPWPWPDDCASEVHFIHSLEHMGADPKVFLAMMRELYRVCSNGAKVAIRVPHPRHDTFINDPTHVRAITAPMLQLFDKARCDDWKARGCANSPLAHYTGVDFRIVEFSQVAAPAYREKLRSGELTAQQIAVLAEERNNVIEELRIVLEANKPS